MLSPLQVALQGLAPPLDTLLIAVQGFGDAEVRQGGGKAYARSIRSNSREVLLEAAEQVQRLLEGKTTPVPVKRLTKKVKQYAEDKFNDPQDVSALTVELQMRIYELRMVPDMGWLNPVITEMEVMLEILMQDEEDILVLLLAE